uniref:Uncharacterized protein n=1 Tax=Arundo donax TaxID=35708 RepID=A0A0A9BX95_ARUDO
MFSKVEQPTLSKFVIGKGDVHGGGDSVWGKQNIFLPGHLHSYSSEISAPVDIPYSLSMLLEIAADMNKSVVLGVAGASYRDMLMSWACRLRHLRVNNFIVCALDHETYEFSVLLLIYSIISFISLFSIIQLFILQIAGHLKLSILILGFASFQRSVVSKQCQL